MHVIDRQTGVRINLCLGVAIGVDVSPIVTVAGSAATRRRGDAVMAGTAADAVVDRRIVVIGLRISRPG